MPVANIVKALIMSPATVRGKFLLLCRLSIYLIVVVSGASYAVTATDESNTTAENQQAELPKKNEPKFNIWEFEVHGTKVIKPEFIENTLSPYLGPDKTFPVVEQAAHAIEKLYRDAGYPVVVVDIPEQDVVGGKIKLNVTEGIISNIKVSGSNYFLLSDIKQRTPSLSEGGALYIPDLQKDLNKLNSLTSDLRVTPVLKEGDAPGTVNVELKVKDKLPLHGEIEYNNYASANTSPTRLSASVSYDNLWSKYHSLSLQMQITPEATDEIRVLSSTYVLPVEDGSSRLALYGVYSQSRINIITEVNGLKVLGESKIAGLRYVKPMNVSSEFQHVLTLGFDYKDVLEAISFDVVDGKAVQASKDIVTPVTFAVWTTEYKATWRKPESTTQLGGGAYFGVKDIFNSNEEFVDKRYGAEPNFIYLKSFFQRDTNLPADFMLTNKFKLQYTEAPLISNEQISIGGASSVRGYFESQNIGDRGAIVSVDFYSPKLLKSYKALSDLKIFTFLEGGVVEILKPLPDQTNNFNLASAGIGAEFSSFKNIKAELSIAFPLKDACKGVCGTDISDIEKGESHTSFNVTYKY